MQAFVLFVHDNRVAEKENRSCVCVCVCACVFKFLTQWVGPTLPHVCVRSSVRE